MPQIFQVLRCFKCSVFQIHQCKKSNKWQCKLCGEKQSIKRHYGIGTGKECRMHVQKLNMLQGDKEEADINLSDFEDCEIKLTNEDDFLTNENKSNVVKNSKWEAYVDKNAQFLEVNNEPVYIDNKEVVLEIPQKRKALITQIPKKVFNNNKKSFSRMENCTENRTCSNCDETYIIVQNLNNKSNPNTNKPSTKKNSKWETYLHKCEEQAEKNSKVKSSRKNSEDLINESKCDYVVLEPPQKQMCAAKMNINTITKNKKGLFDCQSNQLDNLPKNTKRHLAEICVDTKLETQSLLANSKAKEINTASKWCKYIDSNEYIQDIFPSEVKSTIDNAQHSLFSLCDDSDLDSILTI